MHRTATFTPARIAIKIAREFIDRLIDQGYQPERAILFGSHAKLTQRADSDIDLAVWDKKFEGCIITDTEPILKLLVKNPRIELHTFGLDDTVENNGFVQEILRTGIEIDLHGR